MTIQVLGLCRFSLLSEGAFQSAPAEREARRRFLYDPRRLAERMVWFEQVLMPSIRAQTDRRFRLIVLTGSDLPEPFAGRLAALVAELPELVLDRRPPGPHRELCRAALAAEMDRGAEAVAHFRLDDDDAVAVDFVQRLHADYPDGIGALFRRYGRLSVDHSKGVVLDSSHGAEKASLHLVHTHNWTPGLTLFLPPGDEKSLLDFPHHKLIGHMPGIALQDQIMYLRGKHGRNDSAGWGRLIPAAMTPARAERLLRDHFDIDFAGFRTALAETEPKP